MRIAIVDYSMGNLKSISSVVSYLGVKDIVVSSDYETLLSSDKLILPGVGSFGKAISEIKARKLDVCLGELALKKTQAFTRHLPGNATVGDCQVPRMG